MTTTFQGFTIQDPPAPSGTRGFQPSPTPWQVVDQNDTAMLEYVRPAVPADLKQGIATTADVLSHALVKESVPGIVTWYCRWVSLFENYNDKNSESEMKKEYSTGVTTTDTKSFGMTLGLAEEVAADAIKAALNVAFSFSSEHSVSLSKSETTSRTFKAEPQTTMQVWQLQSAYVTEFTSMDGQKHSETLMDSSADTPMLTRTFVDTSQASSDSGAGASAGDGAAVADNSTSGASPSNADSSGGSDAATVGSASTDSGSPVADNSSPDPSSSSVAEDSGSSGNGAAVADNSASSTSSDDGSTSGASAAADSGSSSDAGSSVADNAPGDTSSQDAAVPA